MTDTANLGLPFIAAAQAQKHVTHNAALCILDTLVQLAVLDRDLTAPPGAPDEGERWIVAASATGDWAGHDDDIAAWQDGAWQFSTPKTGWTAFVVDEGTLLVWNGSAWGDFFSTVTSIQNLAMLGVGTTADGTNPFSAKLNNALWGAKTTAEGGDGNLRCKLNKESAAKTLSLLMQTNFSGRAEIGLTGDDDFHVKVSADGAAWNDAVTLARASGDVSFGAATDATAATAAAAVFAGGVGIAKKLYVGTLMFTGLGAAGAPSHSFIGDADTGMWSPAADTLAWSTSGSERMRIGSTGNVGIGTTGPLSKLQVSADLAANPTTGVYGQLEVTGATTAARRLALAYNTTGNYGVIQAVENAMAYRNLVLNPGGGNVGIGETAPAALLDVKTASNRHFGVRDFLATTQILGMTNAAGAYASLAVDGSTLLLNANSGGNVGINEVSPDYRLDVNGTFGFAPGASVTPVDNGDVVFEATNNTTFTIKLKGSDGTVRSGAVTLS